MFIKIDCDMVQLVASLTDGDLNRLKGASEEEYKRRNPAVLNPLDETEIALVESNHKILAIKHYRTRNTVCGVAPSLSESKRMIDKWPCEVNRQAGYTT